MGTSDILLGVTLQWTSIPSRGSSNTLSRFMHVRLTFLFLSKGCPNIINTHVDLMNAKGGILLMVIGIGPLSHGEFRPERLYSESAACNFYTLHTRFLKILKKISFRHETFGTFERFDYVLTTLWFLNQS